MCSSPAADNSPAHPQRNNTVNRSEWPTSLISPDVSCHQLLAASLFTPIFPNKPQSYEQEEPRQFGSSRPAQPLPESISLRHDSHWAYLKRRDCPPPPVLMLKSKERQDLSYFITLPLIFGISSRVLHQRIPWISPYFILFISAVLGYYLICFRNQKDTELNFPLHEM